MIFSVSLTPRERQAGLIYLLIDIFALPPILGIFNSVLPRPLNSAVLNFLFFCINFAVVVLILLRFLLKNISSARENIRKCLVFFLAGYGIYFLANYGLGVLIHLFVPDFSNVNDSSVADMLSTDFYLMAAGTVFLVPITEELLYRGVLFRGFYDHSPVLSWILSVLSFALIHVVGFVGSTDFLTLALCFVQYLPAGLILCWSYCKTDSIITPILIHMAVNLTGILILR